MTGCLSAHALLRYIAVPPCFRWPISVKPVMDSANARSIVAHRSGGLHAAIKPQADSGRLPIASRRAAFLLAMPSILMAMFSFSQIKLRTYTD